MIIAVDCKAPDNIFDAAAAGKYNKMVSRRMDLSFWRGDRVAEGAALEILLIP
jgi:hypothetical protein